MIAVEEPKEEHDKEHKTKTMITDLNREHNRDEDKVDCRKIEIKIQMKGKIDKDQKQKNILGI